MAELEPYLVSHLKADTALNVHIGGRVHPGRLPDPPTLPALVYQRISTPRRLDMSGKTIEPSEARFQIDVWTTSHGEARLTATAVRNSLLGFNGLMGPFAVTVPRLINDIDMYDEQTEQDTQYSRVLLEFSIWHDEGDE